MALSRRALTPGLMQQLGEGALLSPLLERVRRDRTLCLELRGGYLNVYYRGGNLLKVSEAGAGVAVEFDT